MKLFNLEEYSTHEDDVKENDSNKEEAKGPALQFEEIVPKAEREARAKRREREKKETTSKAVTSMLISAVLVILAVFFAYGFKNIMGQLDVEQTPVLTTEASTEERYDSDKEYLKLSKYYKPGYIMLCNLPESGMKADQMPGSSDMNSVSLMNGQVFYAEEKGTYEGSSYYRLSDELYGEADRLYIKDDPNYIVRLKDYTELEGYIVITYVSTTGVRMRQWADYDVDNVIGSAYVGDKIQVVGKVTREDDVTAFITEDGKYITTDTRYLNDYTKVVGGAAASTESSAGLPADSSSAPVNDSTETSLAPEQNNR